MNPADAKEQHPRTRRDATAKAIQTALKQAKAAPLSEQALYAAALAMCRSIKVLATLSPAPFVATISTFTV